MTKAKLRLTKLETFLVKTSPRVYDWVDRFFNLPRYLDRVYLAPFLRKQYAKALDLGSGKGSLTRTVLVRVKDELVCLDVNPEELAVARKRAGQEKKLKFVLANAATLPFPENFFDLVFCNCVIEHIKDDRAVFREICRCLKPGGELIITFPNQNFQPVFKSFLWRFPGLRFLSDPTLKQYFTFASLPEAEAWYAQVRWQHLRRGYDLAQITKELKKAGFGVWRSFYYPAGFMSQFWDLATFSFLNRLFPYFLLLLAPLARVLPKNKGNQENSLEFAVKAVKK